MLSVCCASNAAHMLSNVNALVTLLVNSSLCSSNSTSILPLAGRSSRCSHLKRMLEHCLHNIQTRYYKKIKLSICPSNYILILRLTKHKIMLYAQSDDIFVNKYVHKSSFCEAHYNVTKTRSLIIALPDRRRRSTGSGSSPTSSTGVWKARTCS